MKPPFKTTVQLTPTQWQRARALWRDGKDTHEIACAMGCDEAHIYNGLYLLKLRRESEAA